MKVIFSDYDGTLKFKDSRGYDLKLNDSIKNWRNNNNLFVINTGRSISSMIKEKAIYNFEADYYIGCNGSIICDNNFKLISYKYIDFNKVLNIIEYLKEVEYDNLIFTDGFNRVLINNNNEFYNKEFIDLLNNKKIAQVVINFNHDKDIIDKYKKEINDRFNLNGLRNISCIDIVDIGINKYYGIELFKKYINIDNKNIICVGDGDNDLPMLLTYHSYCMKNSKDYIHKLINNSVYDINELIDIEIKR